MSMCLVQLSTAEQYGSASPYEKPGSTSLWHHSELFSPGLRLRGKIFHVLSKICPKE
jgi:hypothetical protein